MKTVIEVLIDAWNRITICLQPIAPKGGTANSGSLQVKVFFGIQHFLSLPVWVGLFLHFPILSQEKCLEQWRSISIKQLDPLLCLWAQSWMVLNLHGSYRWVYNTPPKSSAPPLSLWIHSTLCIWRAHRMRMAK